jgi:hypothetical protein
LSCRFENAAGLRLFADVPERHALKKMPAEIEAGFGESAVPVATPE